MHLFLCPGDSEEEFDWELKQTVPATSFRRIHPQLFEGSFSMIVGEPLPQLAFARQFLPDARRVRAPSIRTWAVEILSTLLSSVPDEEPWLLHITPHYGSTTSRRIGARAWHSLTLRPGRKASSEGIPSKRLEAERMIRAEPRPGAGSHSDSRAGQHRCQLIREATIDLLRSKRRYLLRQLHPVPECFTAQHTLVQVLLTEPDAGFISVARAPLPFAQRHLISAFPKGEIDVASDKSAPSRAFAKLLEAELRLGRAVQAGETCVDLGASPGSWTYIAERRGAMVTAVDHTALREDLMSAPGVQFRRVDAFAFRPPQPADWLLCDVIADPEQTAGLLLQWLREGWCRHFIVTLKMKERSGMAALAKLKHELPPLTSRVFLKHLCANKKELCAFGSASTAGPA